MLRLAQAGGKYIQPVAKNFGQPIPEPFVLVCQFLPQIADQPAGRGEMDETARLLFAKIRRRGFRYVEHAGQIHVDDAPPILIAHLVPDGVAEDSGVVHDGVDAAEFSYRVLDDARGFPGIGDIAEIGGGLGRAIRNFRRASSEPDEIDITPKNKKPSSTDDDPSHKA